MRPRKYHVTLTEEEHSELLELVKKGKTQAYRITHAQVLLKLDENYNEKPWTTEEIAKAYNINPRTVSWIGRRFVEGGLSSALERQKQQNRHHKITGEVQAQIITIACSDAPEGRDRWTLQLIADRLVELKVVESISATAVGTTLKKVNLNRGSKKRGVFQNREQNL